MMCRALVVTLMDKSAVDDENPPPGKLISKRSVGRKFLVRRLIAAGLLAYFIWILEFTLRQNISGNYWTGVWWTSGGPGSLLPIPRPAGEAAIMTPARPIDVFFYLGFIHNGVWVIWVVLLLLYIFSPYFVDFGVLYNKLQKGYTAGTEQRDIP